MKIKTILNQYLSDSALRTEKSIPNNGVYLQGITCVWHQQL